MSRSPRRYRDVDGILLLDKVIGLSSNAALQQVRYLFGAAKAGHAGSLDPLASGLLPICFGQATKVCGQLLNSSKTYRVVIELGARTESLDLETPIVERAAIPDLGENEIAAVVETFAGAQEQIPPMHSALKHEGQRLYELARRGQTIERAVRQITIHRIAVVSFSAPQLVVEVCCSKGTYIRTLAADIAARLGTLGYVAELRRLGVDPFEGLPMYSQQELAEIGSSRGLNALDGLLMSSDIVFKDLPKVDLDANAERGLRMGQSVMPLTAASLGASLRAYGEQGDFLGLVVGLPEGRVRPTRLLTAAVEGDAGSIGKSLTLST